MRPAAGGKLLIGVAEAGRRHNPVGRPASTFGVTRLVERIEDALRKARGFFEHRDGELVRVLGESWTGSQLCRSQ